MTSLDWLNQHSGAVTAVAAVIAVFVNIIYTFMTIFLWFETRRQALLTRHMFEASYTPYVSIRVEEALETDEPGVLSFNMVFQNHGPVLAHIMKWEMHATLTDLALQEHPLPHIDVLMNPTNSTLAPNEQRIIQPRFYAERLQTADLTFRLVAMLAYQGSGPSTYVTDFEANRTNAGWITQQSRMRRPEDLLFAAMGMKHW
jgi:hypothetical protein